MFLHSISLCAILAWIAPPAASAGTTMENLNAAYERESNQVIRYESYARQAANEGHTQAAKLFRATAASEAIHRDIDKRTIIKLGGHIQPFKLARPAAATTEENLAAAIRDEGTDSTSLYPGFAATAKTEGLKAATRAFNYALNAEKRHAQFFQQALGQLASDTPVNCFVCEECGLLLTRLPTKKCPLCDEGLKAFKKIS